MDDRAAPQVRRVHADTWREYRDLRLRALQAAPDAYGSTYEREAIFDEREWRRRLSGADVVAAYSGGPMIGTATGFDAPEAPAGVRFLVAMWVEPSARGTGVARALVQAVIDGARRDGRRELTLSVARGNDVARRLYERCGFAPTGNAEPMPRKPELVEDELALRL